MNSTRYLIIVYTDVNEYHFYCTDLSEVFTFFFEYSFDEVSKVELYDEDKFVLVYDIEEGFNVPGDY